jgi:hypothetical protein
MKQALLVRFIKTILVSGFVVGVMDGVAATIFSFVFRGQGPGWLFRYVASGAFGKEAFSAGPQMVVWGLLFHFSIATAWTGLFFLAWPHLTFLSAQRVASGAAYGLLVWLVMNLVILPMSQVGAGPIRFTVPTGIMILIHVFIIGVPISLMAQRYYAR